MHSVCTVCEQCVHYMHSVCTVCVQYVHSMCTVCALCVQYVYCMCARGRGRTACVRMGVCVRA